MFRRIVTENSKEYKELVRNYNKDIVFESGDGKRIMTKRCKEKLDKLAKLVKLEWPHAKLRVIEAYDKYGQHPPNSLHYEARAVDITTSDRDKSKIGNLGALAYQAGFDWVYYESLSYIHASVVSENEVSLKQADCFPGSAKVQSMEHGEIELEKIKAGDRILTANYVDGVLKEFYTEVIGFLDHVNDIEQPYLVFKTDSGISFAATKSHLIYTLSKESLMQNGDFQHGEICNVSKKLPPENLHIARNSMGNKLDERVMTYSDIESSSLSIVGTPAQRNFQNQIIDIKPALSLSIGDEVIILNNGITYKSKIIGTKGETLKGAIAPLTAEGNFIMNNILVSCYAKIDDAQLAHAVFMPYRCMTSFLSSQTRQYSLDWYVAFLRGLNDAFGIVMVY